MVAHPFSASSAASAVPAMSGSLVNASSADVSAAYSSVVRGQRSTSQM
ncbi:hypothetical protein ACVW07_002036 [Cellulomonas sp. URHB0016]